MISINADTLVGLAMILSAVVFMLGHAAGYWRAKDVERRRRARAHHPAGRAR